MKKLMLIVAVCFVFSLPAPGSAMTIKNGLGSAVPAQQKAPAPAPAKHHHRHHHRHALKGNQGGVVGPAKGNLLDLYDQAQGHKPKKKMDLLQSLNASLGIKEGGGQ